MPFSTDWFLTWQENIHSSLFLNIYEYLSKGVELDSAEQLTKAYRLYSEQIQAAELDVLLSFTRAWRLVKFVDAQMLTRTQCSVCKGQFVTEPYENARHYQCGLCNPPARAGKSKAAGSLMLHCAPLSRFAASPEGTAASPRGGACSLPLVWSTPVLKRNS